MVAVALIKAYNQINTQKNVFSIITLFGIQMQFMSGKNPFFVSYEKELQHLTGKKHFKSISSAYRV